MGRELRALAALFRELCVQPARLALLVEAVGPLEGDLLVFLVLAGSQQNRDWVDSSHAMFVARLSFADLLY